MVKIIPADFRDIPMLRQISIQTQIETFGPHNDPLHMDAYVKDAYSFDKIESEFAEPLSSYYIAWDGSIPAGFMRMRVTNEVDAYLGANAIELQRLYVTRNYQGKKVGTQMMQKAFELAREGKYEWFWLGVWEKNFKAQEFYSKLGFERFSEHTFWMGPDPQVDWLLKLRL